MILVDSSVWIGHLHRRDDALFELLHQERVLVHPFVIGEVALGHLRDRQTFVHNLQQQMQAAIATDDEVLRLVEREKLFGAGIGYVDAHLLASVRLTASSALWTRDKRLQDVASRLGMAADIS